MKRILIINNDFDTMSLLKKWLERKHYIVRFTSNRMEAGKLLEEFFPQLILVDVLQQEVIKDFNKDERCISIPILLMTGYNQKSIDPELIHHDTIEKPFDLALLTQKIEARLSQYTTDAISGL